MGFLDKVKNALTVEDEFEEEESSSSVESPAEEKIEIKYRGLTTFKQVKEVCDCLKNDFPVVINLQSANSDVVCRVTDYLSGVLDAIDGEIIAIGINMWICAPKDVIVEGKYVEMIKQEVEDQGYNKRYQNRTANDSYAADTHVSPYAKK